MKWLSTREIFLEPSWSKEMRSWLFYMRRSRFKRVHWRKEKFTIKRDSMILKISGSKLLSSKDSWSFPKMKQHVSQISRERSTCSKKNILSSNRRLNTSTMSLKSHLMSIDGESLNAQTQKLMKWFKRSKVFKRDWSQKLKKSVKRMSLFRRRKNFISSSKTFWLNKVAQK